MPHDGDAWAPQPPAASRHGEAELPHCLDVRLSVVISDSGHMIHQEDICAADV